VSRVTLHHTATHCSYPAVLQNTLQHTTTRCNTLHKRDVMTRENQWRNWSHYVIKSLALFARTRNRSTYVITSLGLSHHCSIVIGSITSLRHWVSLIIASLLCRPNASLLCRPTIEIHRINFRCTHFSSSFRKWLRQHYELMQRIQCCIYALINIARIARNEYCLFGLWLRCSRWWNQAYQRWLTVHTVSGTRACIKSTVCLTTAKRRWPIIRIDP